MNTNNAEEVLSMKKRLSVSDIPWVVLLALSPIVVVGRLMGSWGERHGLYAIFLLLGGINAILTGQFELDWGKSGSGTRLINLYFGEKGARIFYRVVGIIAIGISMVLVWLP